MIRRLCCAGALVLGLLATSIPAASAATVSPSKWAPKFCTAVIDYQTTISDKSDAMTSALDNVSDLAEARDQIVSFLGDMVTAANTAKKAVQAAGVPSSPNGGKIEALFVSGLGASAKVFAKGKQDATKLPTSSASDFKVKGKELGVNLSDAGQKLSKSFSGINKLDTGKKLENAVKATPECAPLV
jgi:hypothetical protein